MRKIVKNAIKCRYCGVVIESKRPHDFVTCPCGCCSVDGGHDSLIRSYKNSKDDFVELSQYEGAAHYPLSSKQEKPGFEYMVVVSGEFDYYTYSDFDAAVRKAHELGSSYKRCNIFEMSFVNDTREWRVQPTFYVVNGKLHYDKYAKDGLHVLWHTMAGNWMNPNE